MNANTLRRLPIHHRLAVAVWAGLLATILCVAGSAQASEPKKLPAADPNFIPLGVYWAGEYLYSTKEGIDWPRVEAALDDLAKHHVNAVWLTHRSAGETAEFARRAAKRGIFVVASIGELAGEIEHIRKGDHKALIARTLNAWGDAPRPIAWGLGDEPSTNYMAEMAAYVRSWKQHAPKEPVTTVVMHFDIPAAGKAGFDILCADIYPYFSNNNPNGFGLSTWEAWQRSLRKLRQATAKPWMMGQAYQEPWGPYEISEKGNIVYLPGGGPHWVMPSPAQIRWQALATLAEGGKGMFYFLYRCPTPPSPKAQPTNLPSVVRQRTDSGSPKALIYDDGRPTPQYEALGTAYGWIAKHAKLLAPLQPTSLIEVWESSPTGGNVVSLLAHPTTGKRYLVVVGQAEREKPITVSISLGAHITQLRDVDTDQLHPIRNGANYRTTEVTLEPATAKLFECTVDAKNVLTGYSDDFLTDKYTKDAMTHQRVKRHANGVLSAVSYESYEQAYVVYDLEKLLPALPEGGIRMLIYDALTSQLGVRGAFWSVSNDGKTFRKLSENESGKAIFFNERYLKVGLSWFQAASPEAYGCLRSFRVQQWLRSP